MNKNIFKRCLFLIDQLEIQPLTQQSLNKVIQKELMLQQCSISVMQIDDCITNCIQSGNLKPIEHGFDLSQTLTIYAKSQDNGMSEALALFESCIRKRKHRDILVRYLDKNFRLADLMNDFKIPFFVTLMSQSLLLEKIAEKYCFNPFLRAKLFFILNEVDEDEPILSDCTRASFTEEIYRLKKKSEMRNTDLKMIDYKNRDMILSIIPTMGIPVDRDASKDLQAFFKDCLFYEFNHCCAICGVQIPHMLIASHIKPFRDCAHVYEAMDNNNGLLLCRNHDYLFDQGYISFDQDGRILISSPIMKSSNFKAYQVPTDFKLNSKCMSDSRKKFLAYHQQKFFKK